MKKQLPKDFRLKNNKLLYDGVDIGACYREIDGEYVFWPNENQGFMDAFILRGIADTLDALNKETKGGKQ